MEVNANKKIPGILELKRSVTTPVSLAVFLATIALASEPVHAQIAPAQINKLILASKIAPPTASVSSSRLEEQVLVEIRGLPSLNPALLKEKGFLAGRAVMHADPGYVRGVVTRFYQPDGTGYVDVLLTGKDLVSVEAGLSNNGTVASEMVLVPVSFNESAASRFNKYLNAALALTADNELYAARVFFEWALSQDPQQAYRNQRFVDGLFALGKAFDLRGDLHQADLVYGRLLLAMSSEKPAERASVSFDILRQIANYFKSQNDYARAEQAATCLVEAQRERAINSRPGFVGDMRLLSSCYRQLGRVVDAKKTLEEALLLSRNLAGENNPEVALILEDLGDCYSLGGDHIQALSLYKQAKEKYDTAMAARHSAMRPDYEIYQSAMKRLQKKIGMLKNTG
ncbi:tetratricopeptide repeat protein [bacterium]|nr:tetratricopeptide repeat protein [bacterium]